MARPDTHPSKGIAGHRRALDQKGVRPLVGGKGARGASCSLPSTLSVGSPTAPGCGRLFAGRRLRMHDGPARWGQTQAAAGLLSWVTGGTQGYRGVWYPPPSPLCLPWPGSGSNRIQTGRGATSEDGGGDGDKRLGEGAQRKGIVSGHCGPGEKLGEGGFWMHPRPPPPPSLARAYGKWGEMKSENSARREVRENAVR